jgi:hypothetical protein
MPVKNKNKIISYVLVEKGREGSLLFVPTNIYELQGAKNTVPYMSRQYLEFKSNLFYFYSLMLIILKYTESSFFK